MENKLFRKQSLERIKSPDALNDYIHVARPSTWLVLGAIVLFLVGLIAWGTFGRITLEVSGFSVVEGGRIYILVDHTDVSRIEPGMEIRVGENRGEVEIIYPGTSTLGEQCDLYDIHPGSHDRSQVVGGVEGTMRIADGSYDCTIVLKSLTPISLLTN